MPVVETALSSRRIQFIQICSHYPLQSNISGAYCWEILQSQSLLSTHGLIRKKNNFLSIAETSQVRNDRIVHWKFNNLYPFTGCLVKKNFSGNTIAPNANNISHYLKSEGWIFPPASQKHARPGKIIYFTENLTTCLHL